MEAASNKLQKEAKGYLDSLRGEHARGLPGPQCWRFAGSSLESWPLANDGHTTPAMTASQIRIAETIDAFYGDAGTRDGVSRAYKQAVVDLDAETIKALDGPYRWVYRISGRGAPNMEALF